MQKTEILEIINQNPAFHLATIDGNIPRVRGMLLYCADENGIIFHSAAFKDVYKQISANPNVELCFNDFKKNIQIRITGVLEIINDRKLKREISEHPSRVFLKDWISQGSMEDFYSNFIVFRLNKGKAVIWTMATNFDPKIELDF
jgi:pyridoxamine 5'-phosphate oxidase